MKRNFLYNLILTLLMASTTVAQNTPEVNAELENAISACQPINYEQCLSGIIANAGEEDCFTFNGQAGQQVTVFLDNVAFRRFSLRLADPNGNSIGFCNFTSGDCEIDNVTLPLNGTYTITVDGENDATGNYSVCLSWLNDGVTLIAYEQCRNSLISPMGDQDSYTFNGIAGQRVTAFLDNLAFRRFSLSLIDPTGNSIGFCSFTSGDCEIDNVLLTTNGIYTMTVDGEDDATGNYNLCLNWLNDDSTLTAYEQCRNSLISPMGDQDSYTFTGAKGQRVTTFLDNLAFRRFSLSLTDPNGNSIGFCNFTSGDCEIDNVLLPSNGTYTITVDGEDDATGSYNLCLNWLNDDSTLTAYEQCRNSLISPTGDQDSYTFTGAKGQRVTAFLDNLAFRRFSLSLIDPNGNSIGFCSFTSGDCEIDNVLLPANGTYTMTVDGEDDATGSYNLCLNWLNDSATPIAYQQCLSRSISPVGDQDSFTFTGAVGQRVTAFLDNLAFRRFSLSLIDSSGNSIGSCNFTSGDCEIDNVTLPAKGIYTITVDGEGDANGNYNLCLNWLNDSATPIAYGQSLQSLISPAGDQDNFIFDGGAGHRITVFLSNTSFTRKSLRLLAPDGSTLRFCDFTSGNCEIKDETLPITGCYTVTVDGESDATGNYTLSLTLLQGDDEPIAYDQSLNRDLTPACDQDYFTFNGNVNHRITAYLRNLSGAPLSLRLTAPDGTSFRYCDFTTADCQIDNVALLTNGKYTLTVDAKENAVGNYTLALNRLDNNSEPIACDQTLVRLISPMGDQDSFVFNGKAEHRVKAFLRNQTTERLSLRLTASNGTTVGSCDFSEDSCKIETVLNTKDTYSLTVDGEGAATGQYALTLIQLDWDVEPKLIRSFEPREGEICPRGDEDKFVFDAKAGDRVIARLENFSTVRLSLLLTDADGNRLQFCNFRTSTCQIDTTLSKVGKYFLTVDGDGDAVGNYQLTIPVRVDVAEKRENTIPAHYELMQNYPNPFNPSTTIVFALPRTTHVTLKVFDLLGKEIAALVDGRQAAGQHKVRWDASGVESGTYFYQLHAGEFVATKKLILMK